MEFYNNFLCRSLCPLKEDCKCEENGVCLDENLRDNTLKYLKTVDDNLQELKGDNND